MEPGQYTGKTNATPGEAPLGEQAHSETVPSPAPASASQPEANMRTSSVRRRAPRRGGATVRVLMWGTVLAALIAGLALYFRYERGVVPLFGRGR